MDKVLNYALDRLKERSTYLGLLGLLGTFGVHLEPNFANAIASAGVALGGLILVITADLKAHKPLTDKQ